MGKISIVRFAPHAKDSFLQAVMKNIGKYFETNKLSRFGNYEMRLKSIVMLLLYFVPYIILLSGIVSGSTFLFLAMWLIMGFGMAGIGTSIMHDANHGAYSKNNRTNRLIGSILNLIGGYTINWKIQHNVLHHTYTNIEGIDEDIDSVVFLRLTPHGKLYWFHRYQHYYAWFFYMLMTLNWMTIKDYFAVIRYNRMGLLQKQNVTLPKALALITLYKLFYYTYILALPLIFSGAEWHIALIGFILMHLTAGLLLSCIFQPAHVMETSNYPMPVKTDTASMIEDEWAVHELSNTVNFATGNRALSWFVGGLNYQIEHHLFSSICHVHYRKIAPIVKATAEQFNLPYNTQRTFTGALLAHAKMLKKLGRA